MTAACVIVVPCFNEEARLKPGVFAEFVTNSSGFDVLFVDDGSRDRTAAILRGICGKHQNRLDVLTLPGNLGKAEAVRRGVLAALSRGAKFVGYWDADLATPLDEVKAMTAILEADPSLTLVLGSRVQLLGRSIKRKMHRHYLGRFFATCVSIVLDLAVYDTQCGAKIFRVHNDLERIFGQPFFSRWIFDVEIMARLMSLTDRRDGQSFFEHPLRQWHDIEGSKLKLSDFFKSTLELSVIFWRFRIKGRVLPD